MHRTNTVFWKKKSLNQYVLEDDGSLGLLSLLGLGLVAALAHQYFRLGLNLPGHHGLEWFTLLLFGRMQSRYRWAGLLIAGGAASTYLLHASGMSLHVSAKPVFVYLLNGLCVDLLFRVTPNKLPVFIRGFILGGLAFVVKPLVFILAALALGLQMDSIARHGYLYPLVTHLAFGTLGAICGMTLAGCLKGPVSSTNEH